MAYMPMDWRRFTGTVGSYAHVLSSRIVASAREGDGGEDAVQRGALGAELKGLGGRVEKMKTIEK